MSMEGSHLVTRPEVAELLKVSIGTADNARSLLHQLNLPALRYSLFSRQYLEGINAYRKVRRSLQPMAAIRAYAPTDEARQAIEAAERNITSLLDEQADPEGDVSATNIGRILCISRGVVLEWQSQDILPVKQKMTDLYVAKTAIEAVCEWNRPLDNLERNQPR